MARRPRPAAPSPVARGAAPAVPPPGEVPAGPIGVKKGPKRRGFAGKKGVARQPKPMPTMPVGGELM